MPSNGPKVSPLARRASGLGFFKCLRVAHHHGVQFGRGLRAVIGLDPRQVSLDQFNGSGLAAFKRRAQLGNGDFGNLHHVFFAAFKWEVWRQSTYRYFTKPAPHTPRKRRASLATWARQLESDVRCAVT